jgi:phenylalanyl-tRNA synthetase alpha chain
VKAPTPIGQDRLKRLLGVGDLTLNHEHAISQMAKVLAESMSSYPAARIVAGSPIVPAAHNYALLGYPPDAIVQADTYTQWVDEQSILRTQTTSLILEALIGLAGDPQPCTLLAPGMVYRRDVRDRWHCAQPHQMDIWALMPKHEQSGKALLDLVGTLARAGLPGVKMDIRETQHPYTQDGIEINARWQGQRLEVGEAGLIAPSLLARLGIDPDQWGGLAMGLGLDRWVMVRKALPDIRLLRDPLASVAEQMTNLKPWKAVSRQPIAQRELSIARMSGQSEEALTEVVLDALGNEAELLQTLEIKGRWAVDDLAPQAVARLGAVSGQENLLLRLVWQSEQGSLGREHVNAMASRVYRHIHQGTGWEYCP